MSSYSFDTLSLYLGLFTSSIPQIFTKIQREVRSICGFLVKSSTYKYFFNSDKKCQTETKCGRQTKLDKINRMSSQNLRIKLKNKYNAIFDITNSNALLWSPLETCLCLKNLHMVTPFI